MSAKKLPKAIRSTIDQMREAALARSAGEGPAAPARRPDLNAPLDRGAPVWQSGRAADVIEVMPRPVPPAVTHVLVPVAPPQSDIYAARRRVLAGRIVERHAAYSAVGGVIPVPIANVASITAIIVRMVKRLSDLYDVPFERDRARAIVVGLLGGATPTGLATVAASTLVYVIPGANLVGLAVSSVAGSACTRAIGRVFVEHFESGATLTDFPTIEGH
jgi:uncharacterized protein (DUF697 family)